MPDRQPRPVAQITLDFAGAEDGGALRDDLSAVARTGDDLWVAVDEGTALVRLSRTGPDSWGRPVRFPVGALVDLPVDDPEEEIDIEGLAVDDGWLWLCGSHAGKRKKPGSADDRPLKERLERLAHTSWRGNRHLLARIPLVAAHDGASASLAREASPRRAAALSGGRKRNVLTRAVADDPHLAPFLAIPGKDNGFDVEGLTVGGGRVFLGLRGPVLRGHAVILVLTPEDDPRRLTLAPCGAAGRPYAKCFLDLHGLGVRELSVDGDDLLVLAGPTMTADGRAVVVRWRGALDPEVGRADTIVPDDRLETVLELPYGVGQAHELDHPEGMTVVDRPEGGRGLLVVYDSPAAARTPGRTRVLADLHAID